jgi:pre-mRNA-processing factor 19
MTSTHTLHSAAAPGITSLATHPTLPGVVATGGEDSSVVVFNRDTGKIVDQLKVHKKKVTDVQYLSDEIIISASEDKTAMIWRKDGKYKPAATLRVHEGAVVGVTVHPSGNFVVTASSDKSWAFWDVATGALREQVPAELNKVEAGYTRVEFHPDGLILGAGSLDEVVRIFDVKQQKNVATFKGHNGAVTGLSFSENGFYLASGDSAGAVKLWDLRKLQFSNTGGCRLTNVFSFEV